MRLNIVVASAISLVICASAFAVDIARDGEALVPIVTDGSEGIAAAVNDLREHLSAMTGAEFTVISAQEHNEGPAIHVGPTHFVPGRAAAAADRWLREQIVQIQMRDGSLYLTGGGADGASFAVYAFLEDICGMRFFHPGALGTHIPQSPQLSFESLDVKQVPSFMYRRMWPSSQTPDRRMLTEWRTWFQRSRQGGPFVHMGHNLFRIVPPELYDEHPEYFPLIGGVRIDPRGGAPWQPELANKGVIELAAQKAIEFFEADPDRHSYSLSMNDWEGWSESEEALAHDPPAFRDTQRRGKARRMIVFANAVAERVVERFPDRYVAFYAYKSTLEPPGEPKVHPNVIPVICHWGMAADPFHPISAPREVSPPNALYREAIRGWSRLAGKLIAREYWTAPYADPLLKAGVAPILFEDIPYYHRQGFIGCNSEANINWGNLAINHYVAARLMWKVDTDAQALLEDYFEKYYGDAARPMRAYFTRVWEAAYKHYLPEEMAVAISEDDASFLAERLQEALEAARNDDLRLARVQMASDLFETWRMREALLAQDRPSPEAIGAYMEHLDALAEQETDALVVAAWQHEFVATLPEAAPYDGPELVPALPDEPIASEEAEPLIARRGGTWLVLVGEDRRIEATVHGVQVGRQYTNHPSWHVVSAEGDSIASGHMPLPGSRDISVEVPEPGLYQMRMNAGRNGCGIVVHNAPAVMVGPGQALCEWTGAMYFWVPEDSEQFTVTLFASRGESARMRIYRPDGSEAFDRDSLSGDAVPATFHPTPEERGKPWRVQIDEAPEGIFEDYSLLLSEDLPPYLATSPGALLIPAER